jgi:hypothetical protein
VLSVCQQCVENRTTTFSKKHFIIDFRANEDIFSWPLIVNIKHPTTPITPCGIYKTIGFPKIKSSTIMLYDYKNSCNLDNATHSREKGKRKINKEKEM